MASKDMSVVMYDGSIRLNYIDKSHYYSVQHRENWDLPEDDPKAWGNKSRPKGTTTLLGDTLEKKGLMTWPMGMALQELFGFYNFEVPAEDEDGNTIYDKSGEPVMVKRVGFSKDKGTMWLYNVDTNEPRLLDLEPEEVMPLVKSASQNYLRKQKKGADIGSIVHEAIEHFVKANPNTLEPVMIEKKVPILGKSGENILDEDGDETFNVVFETELDKDGNVLMGLPEIRQSGFDIAEQYMWNIKDNENNYETVKEYYNALEEFPDDVKMAQLAFDRFVAWWALERPELLGAEDLVYSKVNNVSGTFDGLLEIKGRGKVLVDWKTSNASKSKAAAMPEGINYQYFIQSAIYAMAWAEMGNGMVDDLAIVSCRKDGGFTIIYASDLGLDIEDCFDWAESVIACYMYGEKVRKGLIAHAEDNNKENTNE